MASALMLLMTDCAQSQEKEMKTFKDSVSYGIGLQTGQSFIQNDIEVDMDLLIEGMKAGMDTSKEPRMNDAQMMAVFQKFQVEMQEKMQKKQAADEAERMKSGESNLAEANKFLDENKSKPGVKTTASGLQYIVIKEGTGKSPDADDNVKVHYHGTFPNGEVFDSSVERGEPIEFPLNGVIKGWTEGLQLMKEGGKYKFFIHPDLGYGPNGRGAIGPNQALIFEVELIEVKPN